ncbi:Membrane protein insertase YidC [bioreactor metagenome]|uniref:Membrane protein insertase YidC n=1 Tax=bioreactor metagenome TaxID=1076179 RepID=A0A644X0K2_9ZZZZ
MKYNQILGFVLIFGIIIGFSIWNAPSKEEREKAKAKQDSIAKVQKEQDSLNAVAMAKAKDSTAVQTDTTKKQTSVVPAVAGDTSVTDSVAAFTYEKDGAFYTALEGTDTFYVVENNLMKVKISTKGAAVKQVELKKFVTWNKKPLEMFYSENSYFNLSFHSNQALIKSSSLYFQPFKGFDSNSSTIEVKGDSVVLSFRAPAKNADGTEAGAVLFNYTFFSDSYLFKFNVAFENRNKFLNVGNNFMTLEWNADIASKEKSLSNERSVSTVYYADNDLETDYLNETRDDQDNIKTSVKWVSFKQQFFATSLIADDKFSSAEIKSYTRELSDSAYLKTMQSTLSLELNTDKDSSINFSFYSGPLKYKTLRQFDLKLERQIPLGWSFAPLAWINRYIVIPVFNWLESYALNYGIIILILTIMLKVVLFPIALRTYKSSAKMRILKPDVDAIAAKFPKKEDAMKKQQATMDLYKKAGASPLSGCFPMLLQFPILIALFRFFPASIELRQQPFLWADDLSAYDSVLDLGFNIPFYGDHVSLFCLLMTISTFIYTRLNEKMMGSTNTMPGMRTMMYLMPVMFLGFFNSYSSGLSYYYLLANLITFAQMFAIRYFVKEDKVRALIEHNRKKPVKKSSWAKRLEEAQKMSATRQPKKK